LPSGGLAYPLATPGIRLKTALSSDLTLATAIFNGDPAPAGTGDAQSRDSNGTTFRLDGGYFAIAEADYNYDLKLFSNSLPGTAKLGGWYNSGRFADERFDAQGLSLANPVSSAAPALHDGNFGAYLIVDQLLSRTTGTSDQGWSAFFRVGEAPADRNLIAFHADAGTSYTGLIPGRDNDVIGLAVSYEEISGARRGLARDVRHFTDSNLALPDFESAVEVTYQTQITPWLIAQPDLQWVVHPGAHLTTVSVPAKADFTRNALVGGIRLAILVAWTIEARRSPPFLVDLFSAQSEEMRW
jgi:porin